MKALVKETIPTPADGRGPFLRVLRTLEGVKRYFGVAVAALRPLLPQNIKKASDSVKAVPVCPPSTRFALAIPLALDGE